MDCLHKCDGGSARMPKVVGTVLLKRPSHRPFSQGPTWSGSGTAAPYQVEVLADGYRMDGKTWASLSAIERHITGTQWSGPRFFGLTARRTG